VTETFPTPHFRRPEQLPDPRHDPALGAEHRALQFGTAKIGTPRKFLAAGKPPKSGGKSPTIRALLAQSDQNDWRSRSLPSCVWYVSPRGSHGDQADVETTADRLWAKSPESERFQMVE
jgi:hypothetical protein